MNILAIGNSFSSDATRYLHGVAKGEGEKLKVVNLYISGCSLERHFRNMLSEERVYELQVNGEASGFRVSLKEALLNRAWDVVTMQQASCYSPRYETYQPYLCELSSYVKRLCPGARQVIHQTWSYEKGSEKLCVQMGYAEPSQMTADIVAAYARAVEAIEADAIIPSGELFAHMLESGIETVHRDTFHASRGLGRYALALLWYGVLTGKSVEGNAFSCLDEPITEEQRAIAIRCVTELLKN